MSSTSFSTTSRVQNVSKVDVRSCDKQKDSRIGCVCMYVDSLDSFEIKPLTVLSSEHNDPDYQRSAELTRSYVLKSKASMLVKETNVELALKGYRFEKGTFDKDNCCPVNFEEAVRCYSEAADKGSALGLFRLGLMTQEGKGVAKDMKKGHDLLLQASCKKPVLNFPKRLPGLQFRNPGVAEACHALGNAFFCEIGVDFDFDKAMKYYHKALELGFVISACSIGLLLVHAASIWDSRVSNKAMSYLKLSAYFGVVSGMETLAENYAALDDFTSAQKWFHFAVHKGSVVFKATEEANKYLRDIWTDLTFDLDKFERELEEDVKRSDVVGPLLTKIKQFQAVIAKGENSMSSDGVSRLPKAHEMIKSHRQKFWRAQELRRLGITGQPLDETQTPESVDPVGLIEIFLQDIECLCLSEATPFKGCVLKVTVIEDVVEWAGTLRLLVKDFYNDVGRLIVSNYPQKEVKVVQEELGFGCSLSVLCPRAEKSISGDVTVYVNNPSEFLLRHPTLKTSFSCRYCGEEGGNVVTCEKCCRVTYCSQKCKKGDADDLKHSFVCVKDIE